MAGRGVGVINVIAAECCLGIACLQTHPPHPHPPPHPTTHQAIDLIDEAGSRVRLRHIQLPEEARELDKELKQVGGVG